MVIVLDEQCDRRAGRLACHDPAEDLHGVFLDLHAPAGTVTLLTTRQLQVNNGGADSKPGRHAIQNRSE